MRPSRISLRTRALATLLLAALGGCTPTCEQVCDKLIGCDGLHTERMSSAECEESCKAQQDLYGEWTDEELRDAFDAELECLHEAECADIADDVCYDERVWSYSASR